MMSAVSHRPVSTARLLVGAAASIAAWLAIEAVMARFTHPRHGEMLHAARTAAAAARVVRAEKARLGLLQPDTIDPNRTGLIGPEHSEITTSIGILEAKRTATNPDLAAALVRQLSTLPLRHGDVAVLVLSGSFVGANIAVLAAVEALSLEALVIDSLGASMFGATDPSFNWLDIESTLRARGVLRSKTLVAVLGGGSGIGRNLEASGAAALRAAAARRGVELADERKLAPLIDDLEMRIVAAAGDAGRIGVFINVGGPVVALGTCEEADRVPIGLSRAPLQCSQGTPGLLVRLSRRGVPIIHLLNMRRLAIEYGLPYDPRPLPTIGNNPRVYAD